MIICVVRGFLVEVIVFVSFNFLLLDGLKGSCLLVENMVGIDWVIMLLCWVGLLLIYIGMLCGLLFVSEWVIVILIWFVILCKCLSFCWNDVNFNILCLFNWGLVLLVVSLRSFLLWKICDSSLVFLVLKVFLFLFGDLDDWFVIVVVGEVEGSGFNLSWVLERIMWLLLMGLLLGVFVLVVMSVKNFVLCGIM